MKISKNISNFVNIVFQNSKKNLESLFDIMTDEISQSNIKSLFIISMIQFFATYVDFSEMMIILLKNLHVMMSNVSKLFDIVMIKFMITVWNKINENTIDINSS